MFFWVNSSRKPKFTIIKHVSFCDIFFKICFTFLWYKSLPCHILSRDHFRSWIICGPKWGSFAVWDDLRSWDHLRTSTVSQLKRNPSQNYTGCTFKFLLRQQREVSASTAEERKVFHHWFRRREFELLRTKYTVLTLEQFVPLLCSNEGSSHDIVLHTKRCKVVIGSAMFANRLLEQCTKI